MNGRELRMDKLFSRGENAVVIAVDHGYMDGPIPGMENLPETVRKIDPAVVKQFHEGFRPFLDAGKLKHGDYDTRLARVIQELRERKVDADRPGITAAIDGALKRGVITPGVKEHLEKRLGLK